MQRTFSPINHVKLARDRLSKLRQTYSVQGYVWRFQSLCLEIPHISEGEILDRFVRGPKGQIRKEVELRGLTNFQEIVQTAQRVNAIHYQNRGSFSTPSSSYSNGPAPMELGALQGRQPARQNIPKNQQRRQPRQNPNQLNQAQRVSLEAHMRKITESMRQEHSIISLIIL